jgi:hypothetical protein
LTLWFLNVFSEWRLERDGQTLLTSDNEGTEDLDPPVGFLVGTSLTDVEGEDPDGGDIVFVFDGVCRLRVTAGPDDDESWVFIGPDWFFVYQPA